MGRRDRKCAKNDVLIDAGFRIKAEKMIQEFCSSNDTKYTFPSLLTNVERAFVHQLCPKFSLKSKSDGYGKHTAMKPSQHSLICNETFQVTTVGFRFSS
jgi:hypothetical protein